MKINVFTDDVKSAHRPLQPLLHEHNHLPIPKCFPIFVQRTVPVIKRRALQQKLQLAVANKTFKVGQHLEPISNGALLNPSRHPKAVGRNVLEDESAGGDFGSSPGPATASITERKKGRIKQGSRLRRFAGAEENMQGTWEGRDVHAAISDKFCVGAKSAGDREGRRAANGVEAEFGIAEASERFVHAHFSYISARGEGGSHVACSSKKFTHDALLGHDNVAADALEVINSRSKIWARATQVDGLDALQLAQLNDGLAHHAVGRVLNDDVSGFERNKVLEHAVSGSNVREMQLYI